MENCLVTKYKASVKNDNLPVFDAIRLNYNGGSLATTYIYLDRTADDNLYLKSNKGVFDNGDDEYEYSVASGTTGRVFVYTMNNPFYVNIKSKQGIKKFRIDIDANLPSFAISTESFKYCENLERIEIPNYPTATDVSFIGYLKGLTYYAGSRGKWFGTIESIVEIFCKEFPTESKELTITFYKSGTNGGNVTFNNTTFLDDGEGKIVFSNGTASVYDISDANNPVLMGTYNGTSWTYSS